MSILANNILKGLVQDEDYMRKCLPFLKEDYFVGSDLEVFKLVKGFVDEYNHPPSSDAFSVLLDRSEVDENQFEEMVDIAQDIYTEKEDKNTTWLYNETERFCQDKAVHNAVRKSVMIMDGRDESMSRHAIPDLLKEALSVSFNGAIGHSYFDDAEKQHDYYHDDENKFPFDIDLFNTITNGGVPNKTLNIFLAGINVGKTIWLCHQACHWLSKGKNVLFISMETREEGIRHRCDANLLQMDMQAVEKLDKEQYMKKIKSIRNKTKGNLVVKEYPAGQAHAGHFRHLLNELSLKKNFAPDVICIDYLGICASQRLSMNQSGNTNTYFTEVAKELHGLAKEFDVPIWTAHQYGRAGQSSSDVDMTDVSQAIGIAATADFMIAGISNDELEEQGQLIIKQLKNRYNSKSAYKKFLIGVDRAKMTYFDLDIDTSRSYMHDANIPDDHDQFKQEVTEIKTAAQQWSF